MKLIIQEQERKRILNLYEIETKGPEESEFVTYANPFRNNQYSSALRLYSPELKDGDLFIEDKNFRNEENKECFSKLTSIDWRKDLSGFLGKTIRIGDEIKTIGNVSVSWYTSHSYRGHYSFAIGNLLSKAPNYEITPNVSLYDRNNNLIQPNDKLKEELIKVTPKISLKDLPDCMFEIRRIKRQKTDFTP